MKCFNHENSDGVGMCRVCGKALCKECAVTGSMGITCKGECEKTASGLMGKLAKAQKAQGMVKVFSGYYVLVLGILFGVVSFVMGGDGLLRYLIMVPAVALIVWGIILIRKNKK